jgi:orotidine-5'-phosphate decarboxylase
LSVSPNNDAFFAPLFMLTVHTAGGKEMLEAAALSAYAQAKALGLARPLIVGVTVLTSTDRDANLEALVLERARLAKQTGLDGVVASVEEAALIRRELGEDFLIVTPGIRPAEASLNDQKRVATPQAAIKQGSNFLVVGRPIIQAVSPRAAALKILEEIK